MDLHGYNSIRRALDDANIEAVVTPKPARPDEGASENVPYVTIETNAMETVPALVLNALERAQLLHKNSHLLATAVMSSVDKPIMQLHPIGFQPGSLTFQDIGIQ